MRPALIICALALLFALVVAQPPVVEHTTPKWGLEECEKVAEQARRESTVCKDYRCVEHSYGLTVDGFDCGPYDHD